MYAGSTVTKYYHPTFLYESLWNLLGFILIMCFYKKKRFNGQIVLSYITWYGFGRFFIEGLRTDSLYFFGTGIRTSQMVGILSVIAGVVVLIHQMKTAPVAAVPEEGTPAEKPMDTAKGEETNGDQD